MNEKLLQEVNRKLDMLLGPPPTKKEKSFQEEVDEEKRRLTLKYIRKNTKKR